VSDTFIAPESLQISVVGAVAVGLVPQRLVLPYPYSVIGVSVALATAPTGANFIFDVVHGAYNANSSAMTSLWSINNGTSGNPDNRPTIVAASFDQAPRSSAPVTTQSKSIPSIPITTTPYVEQPYLAIPDPNITGSLTFEGTSPVYETEETPVQLESDNDGTDTAFTGGSNYPQEGANSSYGYVCAAGDVLMGYVRQVGSTVAGSGLMAQILIQRL
jgi:hypothetical protein